MSANYRVDHVTRYAYESLVAVAQQLLHFTPRELAWQPLLSHRIDIDPQPDEISGHLDYYGNPVSHLVLAAPHDRLSVHAHSEVRVESRGGAAAVQGSPAWESARVVLRTPDGPPSLAASEFLFESLHVRFGAALAHYAQPSFPAGRPLLEGVLDLNHRIHADFAFDPSATSVSTPLSEVLALRRGVCQDFAHLMIGCLRVMGLSARYVSGYILTTPAPGHAPLVGADASHAWVSAFCPMAGWVDFDPTNDLIADNEHITLGWGRDFADVAPMRGVILGGGEQTLSVEVTVTRIDAAPGQTPDQSQDPFQGQTQGQSQRQAAPSQ